MKERGRQSPFLSDSFEPLGPSIDFDGTVYRGNGLCKFSVQDSSSLVSLKSKDLLELKKILISVGQSKAKSEELINRLIDYTDRDDDILVRGAEKRSYEKTSRDLFPRNRFLSNPGELRNIFGWEKFMDEFARSPLYDELSIHIGDQLNFNTMPTARLSRVFDDDALVSKITSVREDAFFSSRKDLRRSIGAVETNQLSRLAFLPSNYMIVKLDCEGFLPVLQIGVTMTPRSTVGPWEIDYRLMLPRGYGNAKIDDPAAEKIEPASIPRHAIFSN